MPHVLRHACRRLKGGIMPLSKAAQAAIAAITRLQPDIRKSYLDQRAAEDASAKLTVASPRCRIDDIIALASDGFEIPLRVFTPLDIDFSLKTGLHVNEDWRGTVLFFHGGGWANGDINFYTDSCMRTALKLERRVVSVDYRRSPEHPFPSAPEDCYEVARQLYAGTLLPDVNPERIVLFGDSAGGNLATVVSLMARDRGEFQVRTQMLLYPLTYNDHSENTPFRSVIENGEDYLLTRQDLEGYIDMYIQDPADRSNPYFAPLLAPDLSHMPRTLVMTAEYCPLRDEGEVYAAQLEHDGNEVRCYRILDGVHGYFLYPSVLSLVRDTYRIMKHFLDGDNLDQKGAPTWLDLIGTD